MPAPLSHRVPLDASLGVWRAARSSWSTACAAASAAAAAWWASARRRRAPARAAVACSAISSVRSRKKERRRRGFGDGDAEGVDTPTPEAEARKDRRWRGAGGGSAPEAAAQLAGGQALPKRKKVDFPTDSEVKSVEVAVSTALEKYAPAIVKGLRTKGWWASTQAVLPYALRRHLRDEVESLWHENCFIKSQSLRGTTYYDKENVYATEIDGHKYNFAPRMVHYTVRAAKVVPALIRQAFPDIELSDALIGNKLNICTGNGATFDAHLDTNIAEKPFNRKLTMLLYLNPKWQPSARGELTLLGEEGASQEEREAAGLPASLEPISGRLVVFWSDRMLHQVEPSFAKEGGLEDWRVSYTIWFCTHGDSDGPRVPSQVSAAEEAARVAAARTEAAGAAGP